MNVSEIKTLGWQVLKWTAENLLQPDGPKAGAPWEFTTEQARFILRWYAVDESGKFVYRSGMLRRQKGWGKDPVGAALCCVEFVGPCRFSHWEDGEPIAVPHAAAWIQTAAVSREQTRNTMTLFPAMFSPEAVARYDINLGVELIYGAGRRKRIEAVTSSPRALEGGRPTFVLKNETHHWVRSNEGHAMSAVISRNAAKSRDGSTRVLAISNAHAPGEDSDAERDYETQQQIAAGTLVMPDFLYDSVEAPPLEDLNDDAALRAGLLVARGDSEWVDVDRLISEIRDPRTSAATARRYYLNQIAAAEDKPFDVEKFKTLSTTYRPQGGAAIALGFDGSRKRDHTALVATEIATGFQWLMGYWEPEVERDGEYWIADGDVNEVVADAFKRHKVERLWLDPYYWGEWANVWEGLHGDAVKKWPTTNYRKFASAVADFADAIETGELSHDGDARFVAAVNNATKRMHEFRNNKGDRMFTIQKERMDSPLKIDAAVAAVLSWAGRLDALSAGLGVPPAPTIDMGYEKSGAAPEFSGVRGRAF